MCMACRVPSKCKALLSSLWPVAFYRAIHVAGMDGHVCKVCAFEHMHSNLQAERAGCPVLRGAGSNSAQNHTPVANTAVAVRTHRAGFS